MPFKIQRLDNRNRSDIFTLLLEDVHSNLFLIEILMRRGISNWGHEEWFGVFTDGLLCAISVTFGRTRLKGLARLIVPVGSPEACTALGALQYKRGGTELIIGERKACDAFFSAFQKDPVHIYYDQRLYVCKKVSPGESIPIHVATNKHFEAVLCSSAQMMKEDLLFDPMELYPSRFIKQVQTKIEQKKCWLGLQEHELCFTIDIGTQFRMGCQLGGTFVPQNFRKQGIATKGMRAICSLLLQSCDCVTLHVHEQNRAAIRCYEKVGFVAGPPFRLISFKRKQSNAQKETTP